MNGATALPSVRTKSRPSRIKITIGGPSHHFLLTRRYSQISATIENLRLVLMMTLAIGEVNYALLPAAVKMV